MLSETKSRFSPRNGEVILKKIIRIISCFTFRFQSPQWGSNSKADYKTSYGEVQNVSVPAMGK